MEKSSSQKALKVISIINLVMGALIALLAILSFIGGSVLGSMTVSQIVNQGLYAKAQQVGTATFNMLGLILLIGGVISIIEGILGVRAANDPDKIMPVWILSIMSLTLSAATLIMSLFHMGGMTFDISQIVQLILDFLVFWIANNIRNQAAEY
jgi:hypothetical protein